MRTLVLALLFFLSHLTLYADSGYCIRYKAKFELLNGKAVEGYFYYATSEPPTFKFTDDTFQKFIDKLFSQNSDTLVLYSKIQTLEYPQLPNSGDERYQFQTAVVNDIIKLSRKNVLTSHFIDYYPPSEWNLPKEKWVFYNIGQSIIVELTQKEIDLLQQKPIAQYIYVSNDTALVNYDYHLISYNNSKIIEKDLKTYNAQLNALNKAISDCKEWNSGICYQREYLQIKDELKSKNVILFHWAGAN